MWMVRTPKTIAALERTVTNKSEHAVVRSEAAEALAHGHRRTSHRVLRKSQNDASKHVRFWCAFALGEMGDKEAIPALERLAAADKRVVRGFHSVAKEAADALQKIQSKKGRCLFCIRT
jgi:HEAT repeat protein